MKTGWAVAIRWASPGARSLCTIYSPTPHIIQESGRSPLESTLEPHLFLVKSLQALSGSGVSWLWAFFRHLASIIRWFAGPCLLLDSRMAKLSGRLFVGQIVPPASGSHRFQLLYAVGIVRGAVLRSSLCRQQLVSIIWGRLHESTTGRSQLLRGFLLAQSALDAHFSTTSS